MKSLYLTVEASLKALRTEYLDILYLHWVSPPRPRAPPADHARQWDWTCTIEEIMNGLHYLVQQRKVLYLVSVPPRVPPAPHPG